MYKAPEKFKIPNEVNDYLADCITLGMIQDLEHWYVTSKWTARFKEHSKKLLKLAETGEPWAQYHLGNMYFSGYFHSSREDFENHYESDVKIGSQWLEKAARQGFVAAVDNLVVVGVGSEADRLREISRIVEKEHPEFIKKWEKDEKIPVITPAFFETVWEMAYGNHS